MPTAQKSACCRPLPVAEMQPRILVQQEDFSLQEEQHRLLSASDGNTGAVVSFTGIVRGRDEAVPLSHLYLEHYPGLTEREIARIVADAAVRWPLSGCTLIHRCGLLAAGEQIVLLLVAAAHRRAAFEAADYLMDYLKTEAPFWKREHFVDGSSRWVAAKSSDHADARRWQTAVF